MGLVENIKLICKEAGTSVPKVEKALGFGGGAIYNWDKNSPSLDKVRKVSNHLKVSFDRIMYGFEATEFEKMVHYVMNGRTVDDFAKDTGIDFDELENICFGLLTEKPDLEVVIKIAQNNPVDYLVSFKDLLIAAGYPDEAEEANLSSFKTFSSTSLTPKDERDIAKELEQLMSSLDSENALAFDGEPLTEEDKELLRASLEHSLRTARMVAKQRFTPKKYKK